MQDLARPPLGDVARSGYYFDSIQACTRPPVGHKLCSCVLLHGHRYPCAEHIRISSRSSVCQPTVREDRTVPLLLCRSDLRGPHVWLRAVKRDSSDADGVDGLHSQGLHCLRTKILCSVGGMRIIIDVQTIRGMMRYALHTLHTRC